MLAIKALAHWANVHRVRDIFHFNDGNEVAQIPQVNRAAVCL
jgi:hypothetical protein